MHNQYGAGLRELVTSEFAVDTVVSMHDVDAFVNDVSAYPAITVLRRRPHRPVLVSATTSAFNQSDAQHLAAAATNGGTASSQSFSAARITSWPRGKELWPSGPPDTVRLVRELEARLPALEDAATGARVGIGVATGADDVFVTRTPHGVESARLLPLATSRDIVGGSLHWDGRYLVNPWDENGLVDLDDWPALARCLDRHGEVVRSRYVARNNPTRWHRTIDRVNTALTDQPKLLLQDLKASADPVLDSGGHYPHHNLYYVVSDQWDLEVLGGLLLSDVTNPFIGTYCVMMRGGTYRFQAQYLRKIRVPSMDGITAETANRLRSAFRQRNVKAATSTACEIYEIDSSRLDDALRPLDGV